MKKYNLAPGDFPEIEAFRAQLRESDFTKFHSLKEKMVLEAESCLGVDFPRLMEALPRANDIYGTSAPPKREGPLTYDEPVAVATAAADANPFDDDGNNPWGDEGM